MKGITFIYCFVVLSEATTTQKIISAAACLLVVLCALFIVKWYAYRSFRKAVKAFNFFGSSLEERIDPKEAPVEEKKVVTIYDYYQDPLDKHRFISSVDPRLTVREIDHKNRDLMSYTTSWPHFFTDQQLAELQKMILEITKLIGSGHQLVVTKSPAANFSDFQSKLIREIFAQIHRQYAMRLFWQKAEVIPTSVFLEKLTGEYKTITINFQFPVVDDGLLSGLMTIDSLMRVSHMTRYPQAIFLHKKGDYSWHDVKQEVMSFFKDYFPAGIEVSGDWSSTPRPVSPIEVSLLFKGKCELVLTFSGIHLQERIKDLMKAEFWGIDSVHVHYTFDPRESVVTLILCPEIDFFQPFVMLPPILKKYDGQLNFNLKVIHPAETSKNSQPIPISFQINAFGQLAFFLPFDIDSMAIEKELLKIEGVAAVDFGYEIHTAQETRFVVSKKAEMTWSELFADILSALVIVSPRTLTKQGEWPKDVVKVKTDGNSGGHDNMGPGNLDTYSACTL